MSLKTDHLIALGLDIGGTKIKSVALTAPDKVIDICNVSSDANQGPEAVRKAIGSTIQYYQSKNIAFSRIGLGCAGAVNPKTGVVVNSPNFKEWKNVPLKEWIEKDFGLPVSVGNDANLAAFTEWKVGNAQDCTNAVVLTFGTGIGGGVILNSKLYTGSTGTAPELGHFSIRSNGVECACGNRGCFERYCSASALERLLPGYTAKEIFSRILEHPFKEVLEQFFIDLKIGLVSIANVFDPDCILLGGGLSQGIFARLPDIEDWIKHHAFPTVAAHIKIGPTKHSNQSGAIGAALLALDA